MQKKIWLLAAALFTGACSASSVTEKPDFSDQSKATLLMTVGEGWAFNSGQAYAVLSSDTDAIRLRSMTDASGGSGTADKVEPNTRAYEFNAVSVNPGQYAITDWGFEKRRGIATNRRLGGANVEAGNVYYIGSFYSNNITQTAANVDRWNSERAAYLQKYPELAGKEVSNISDKFTGPCWKMDVSDEIAADSEILGKIVNSCR